MPTTTSDRPTPCWSSSGSQPLLLNPGRDVRPVPWSHLGAHLSHGNVISAHGEHELFREQPRQCRATLAIGVPAWVALAQLVQATGKGLASRAALPPW